MTKQTAERVQHLTDVPLDLPGVFLRVERRWWADGSSCLHIAKWGVQPKTGRSAPWWPQQYTQVPWALGEPLLAALEGAVRGDA